MMKPKRPALALALLLAIVMLFFVLYIALEAHHDCCGESCVICDQLRACEDLLRDLLPTAALLMAVWRLCALIRSFIYPGYFPGYSHTLIALKVKLSD